MIQCLDPSAHTAEPYAPVVPGEEQVPRLKPRILRLGLLGGDVTNILQVDAERPHGANPEHWDPGCRARYTSRGQDWLVFKGLEVEG